METPAIIAKDLNKTYCVYANRKEKYLDFFLPKEYGTRFHAIQGISFSLERGRSLGLLGLNGSGKSTLANLIAGASSPTSGTLHVEGKISMTAVSSGLSLMLTGRENIIQKGLLLGFSKQQIMDLMPEIIEFSELGDVIDQQVKTYSSGMRSKLGFAISVNVDPDVLIIDEALSVGDLTFMQKCLTRMQAFREQEKTIVFVSHSLSQIRDFCDRAMWLEGGRMLKFGDCEAVTSEYNKFIQWFNQLSSSAQKEYKNQIRKKQLGEIT
ncbi:Teichoic acids export ATP-binding protein TagH [uncultured Flavonifractor sp.]|nr:Teichoic acids export ATP-binding protein TagH [uncultured Flavonifractor sp.]